MINVFLTLFILFHFTPNQVTASDCYANAGANTWHFPNCITCSGTYCTRCDPGYQNNDGICTECAEGEYLPASAGPTSGCLICPGGQYSTTASASCKNCAAGTYSVESSGSCLPCPAGQYSDPKAPSCIACPEGTYSTTTGGAYISSCLPCPAGETSSAGSTACTSCATGPYAGLPTCTKCAAGTYSISGSGACTSCPAGKYSAEGATSCFDCPPGTYSNEGESSCTSCEAGQYSSPGAPSCDLCLPGQFSSKGAGFCNNCLSGQYSKKGAAACNNCPAGSFSGSGAASCLLCPPGTFSLVSGASWGGACTLCPAGFFSKEGAGECVKCAEGEISPEGASTCEPCPPEEACSTTRLVSATASSLTGRVSSTVLTAVSKVGSAICIGSSMFAIMPLMSETLQNVRYMKLTVSTDLENVFQTWDTGYLAWAAPERISSSPGARELPEGFARYEMDPRFLVNYWSTLMTTLAVIFCFVILKLMRKSFKEELAKKKILSSVVDYSILAASNFVIIQVYSGLDDVIFYLVLDLRSTDFSVPLLALSSTLAVVIFLIGIGVLVFHFWFVSKYTKLKKNSEKEPEKFEKFTQKFEFMQVLYDDFKDKTLLKQSFFGVLIIRAMVSSLIIVTIFEEPVFQALALMVIHVIGAVILIARRPFKELYNELVQYFYELLVSATFSCVFVLAVINQRTEEEDEQLRDNICKAIIILNGIVYAGSLAFLCIENYESIVEIHEAWRAYKTAKKEIESDTVDNKREVKFSKNNNLSLENTPSIIKLQSSSPIPKAKKFFEPAEKIDEGIFEFELSTSRTNR